MMKSSKRLFIGLWLACIVGSLALLPYLDHLGMLPYAVSPGKLFLFVGLQSALVFGVACLLSYFLLPKTDLEPFKREKFFKRLASPAVAIGVVLGLALYFAERHFFYNSPLAETHTSLWAGILASIYGAVNEEVLSRLFLFTLIYFLFQKGFHFGKGKRTRFLWITNGIVAIVFGCMHLPAASSLVPLTSFEIFRIVLLNAIPSLVFGWLYFSRGLWAAMVAHGVTDLMIHGLLI